VLDQGCGREASPSWYQRKFLMKTCMSKLKEKSAMINRCFDKIFYRVRQKEHPDLGGA